MSRASGAGSYRAVLALPFALRTFAPALAGRLAYGLLPLATLFTIQRATGSYSIAGVALALFGLTTITLPFKARLADRYGFRRTLPWMALTCALALVAITRVTSPPATLALIVLAGFGAPPLGPAMRSAWRRLTEPPTPAKRVAHSEPPASTPVEPTGLKERAYALDSVAEETLYLAGPLLVGLIISVRAPSDALLVTAFLLFAGTIGMVLPPIFGSTPAPSPVTSPAPSSAPSPAAPSSPVPSPAASPAPSSAVSLTALSWAGRSRGGGVSAGLWGLLAIVLVAGVGSSAAYPALAATAQAHGKPAAAGWLEAAIAAGSVTGGLLWARRRHKRGRWTQLAGLLALQGTGLVAAAVTRDLGSLGAAAAVSGLAMAPLFVVAYLSADELVAPERRTEAGTWVNVAGNAGSAAGSATGGILTQALGPHQAFLSAGLFLVAAALALRTFRSASRPRREQAEPRPSARR